MKRFKKVISVALAVSMCSVFASCSKSAMAERRTAPINLSAPENRVRDMKSGDIFVCASGDDGNNGTKDYPVKTPGRAVELARQLKKTEKVIFFFDGEYNISSLKLTAEDSNITFFAENDVRFNGGLTLNTADFENYKENIKVLDLTKYRITAEDIGKVRAFGQYNTAEKYDEQGSIYCELFFENRRMTLSRYPNEGEYLKTGKILDNGDSKEIYTSKGTESVEGWTDMKNPRGGTFKADKELTDRVKNWKNSADIWMFGYFQYDWADSATPLKKVKDGEITTKYASVYGFKEGASYYFFNVFEELDNEKEWYIDRENMKLYFIPPAGYENKTIEMSLETEDLIQLDGADYVTFDGITFAGTRASAIKGTGNNITVKNCTIKNVGENAVELVGERILIENNEITATGKAGIILTGGDRATLRSSENVVTNNLIHDWSQVYRTYQPAVTLNGVGGVCSHNEIYNSPHEAITYSGNNHIIEYNVIHDVVKESSDAAAIYAGRSWNWYGNVIRYNCIYNIGSGEFTPAGIYFDDALSGQEAYGNLLVNIPGYGFLLGGGRDLKVENNIIVNAATPFLYDDRAISSINGGDTWFNHSKTQESTLWKTLDEYDRNSDPWKNAYPQLSELINNFDDKENSLFAANPANSTVKNNIVAGKKKTIGSISKNAVKYSDISENTLYKFSEAPFYADGDYTLAQCPNNFTQLPFGEMGRKYTVK